MELPSKILEQTALNTRGRVEEHILIVVDKNTHEGYLSQPLQTNHKQFKIAVTFLAGYNGFFNVTNKKFFFIISITDKYGYIQITIPRGAYEIESLNREIRRIIIDEENYTESNYAYTIKPNISTL